MKILIPLLVLLVALPAIAQPVITSMSIDEGKGELTVSGNFGQSGTVTVDGQALEVRSWTPDLITSIIPASGPGSAGPVIVTSDLGTSASSIITAFSFEVQSQSRREYPCGMSETMSAIWRVKFRAPVESMLLLGGFAGAPITCLEGDVRGSFLHSVPSNSGCAVGDTSYSVHLQDSTSPFLVYLNSDPPAVFIDGPSLSLPSNGVGVKPPANIVDPTFRPFSDQLHFKTGEDWNDEWWKGTAEFPVREEIFKAMTPVKLVSPKDGANASEPDMPIEWEPMDWATHYDIQVSTSKEFTKILQLASSEEHWTTLTLDLSVGPTQWWRVRPRNAQVAGVWSTPRRLRIDVIADVTTDSPDQTVAQSWTIYDVLGRYISTAFGTVKSVTSQLHPGNYVIHSGRDQQLIHVP